MTREMRFAVSGAVAFAVMWIILSFQMEGLQWYIGIAGGLAFFIAALVLIGIKHRA
jgi:putative flippase GtrA